MPKKNWLEWSVLAVSLVLVLAMMGYLVYDAATTGDAPPDVSVELGQAEKRGEFFIVPVTVENHGDETAEGVKVEVVLEQNGEEAETGEFEVTYLPRNASSEGYASFSIDPASGELKARVAGFDQP